MWDLPGPGLEPVSPALADGFLTTAPPGKSSIFILNRKVRKCCVKSRSRESEKLNMHSLGLSRVLASWLYSEGVGLFKGAFLFVYLIPVL